MINSFQSAIYYVATSNKPYHLVLENILDNKQTRLILSANCSQELYSKAFEIAHIARRENFFDFAVTKKNSLEQQEKISLGVGKGYYHRGEQEKASQYFSRANEFYKKRVALEQEMTKIFGLSLSEAEFVKPVEL